MKRPARHRALLIVLDGIDGSGKTSAAVMVARKLGRRGLRVVNTSQPTRLPSGISVRRIARSGRSSEKLRRALNYDRRLHRYLEILPALRSADVVISDRYFYSAVYQARHVDELRKEIAHYRRFLPIPDITFLFLPSVLIARERIAHSGRKIDAFETRLSTYRRFYYHLRGYHEVVLCTKNASLSALTNFCVSKIIAEFGASQNKARK